MNIHARRRKLAVSLAVISEVVANVLQEAMENGDDGLSIAEVSQRIYPDHRFYKAIHNALELMKRQGEAVNEGTSNKNSWRLTTE